MTDRVGSGHTGGMAVALGDAIERAEPGGRDLFGEDQGQMPAVRKAGRPPGARNRRTEEYALRLIGRYGDPLAQAVKLAAIDVLEPGALERVARTLGVKREVALDFLGKARNSVLPYLHQEQPRAVEVRRGAPGNPVEAESLFGSSGLLVELMRGDYRDLSEAAMGEGEASGGGPDTSDSFVQNQQVGGDGDDAL